MMKQLNLLLFIIVCFLLCGCEKLTHSQATQMCHEFDSISRNLPRREIAPKIDSIVAYSRNLSQEDQYAVLVGALRAYRVCHMTKESALYLNELSTRTFPSVEDKHLGFLLMGLYAYGLTPVEIDIKGLSALLFEMENRFNLTLQERCRFLTLKAGIYTHCFREYDSAASIIDQAAAYARKNNILGGEMILIYQMQQNCYNRLENIEHLNSISQALLDSADHYGLDQKAQEVLRKTLCFDYYRTKQYDKAYLYLEQTQPEKSAYQDIVAEVMLESGHIEQALAYLALHRTLFATSHKEGKITATIHNYMLGKIAWVQARVHLRQGNTLLYEQYMTEAIGYYDRESSTHIDVNHCSLSEAYARWLWKHGARNKAIQRMEMVTLKLARPGETCYASRSFETSRARLRRLRLLVTFYQQAGQPADALSQLILCDSLNSIYQHTLLDSEKSKNASNVYIKELHHNLALRSAAYLRERHKLTIAGIMLCFAVVAATAYSILFYRRRKELNAIYARQKEIERMNTALPVIELDAELQANMPADKQLYLCMERQMHAEKLFLNPNFSREDICRLVGSNRMYVSTSINKYAGMNFNQWINKARINHALQLIRTGETNLVVLAENSGFSSNSAFYRNFKEVIMLTPTQYIERELKSR